MSRRNTKVRPRYVDPTHLAEGGMAMGVVLATERAFGRVDNVRQAARAYAVNTQGPYAVVARRLAARVIRGMRSAMSPDQVRVIGRARRDVLARELVRWARPKAGAATPEK